MHILIWSFAVLGLLLWTALAWATAWLLGLDPNWVGSMADKLGQLPGAAFFDTWVPGWEVLLGGTLAAAQALLAFAGGAGVVLVWVFWGFGAALLVGAAALGSLAVVLIRRATRPAPPAAPGYQT
jgi:hypothetical protein